MYEFKETGKNPARTGTTDGLKEGELYSFSEKKQKIKKNSARNECFSHLLCLQSEAWYF